MSSLALPQILPGAAFSPDAPVSTEVHSEREFDASLVRRFLGGDEAAFVEVADRHRAKIMAVTLAMLRNRADAEEITQDTLIRAYRGLATFRGDSALSTWLHRIAVNLCRNRYWYFFRRHRQDAVPLDSALGPDNAQTIAGLIADPDSDPARQATSNEFVTLVEQCMDQLAPRHREILTLRNVMHRSYGEIAVLLGINVGTVKSRVARARENLRILLTKSCPEFGADAPAGEWLSSARLASGTMAIAVG